MTLVARLKGKKINGEREDVFFPSKADLVNGLNERITAVAGNASGIELADVTKVSVIPNNAKVYLKWTDPDDLVLNDATLTRWAGTKVIRKIGSAPANVNDGTVVVNSTTKNAYASSAYEDAGLTNGTTYYYRFFPLTSAGTYKTGACLNATPNLNTPNITASENSVTLYSRSSASTKTITITSDSSGAFSVISSDTSIATATISGSTVTITYVNAGTAIVTIEQAANGNYSNGTKDISVTACRDVRYGYRIKKNESDPSARVEYLYDAVGLTPASMNFNTGVFDYGSWGDKWFVTENKPLMLKSDGTVGYYLNPRDYTQKANGTSSDIANTNYDGNAMAQFPLCYVYRYEDENYEYEIVSNVKYDENYEAFAHTRADGTIANFFYRALFGASGDNSKLRSLSGQSLAQSLTTEQQISGATANGAKWYFDTWSQRELIRTLLILMGKSTDTQSVFGKGNCCQGNASNLLTTGTLKDKGQFYGYNTENQQVKVFHIEGFWGDQWLRTAGLINNSGTIYVKMTPEGQGYRVTDVTGYNNTGITPPSSGYIKGMKCSKYGMIPTASGGSESTYYADYHWTNNNQLDYLISGASANYTSGHGGVFSFVVHNAPSNAYWNFGCALSCEQPATT